MGFIRKRRAVKSTRLVTVKAAARATVISTPHIAPVSLQITERLGNDMGISAGPWATLAELDGIAELGLGWVRVSHEMGWNSGPGSLDALQATVTEAAKRGLKVLQAIQKSPHVYSTTDIRGLTDFAIRCAQTGVSALEIGNEWNNSPPFWQPKEWPPVTDTLISSQVTAQVRSMFPSLPIISGGLSPYAMPYSPYNYWPAWWDSAPTAQAAAGYHAYGLHPYCYPESPTSMMTHPEWNPWAGVDDMRRAMFLRNTTTSIWFTEVGCPGFATNAPLVRGVAMTEQLQATNTATYLDQWQLLSLPGEPIFIATLNDGDSATTSLERGLGLIRVDGSKKPAYTVVKDRASLTYK